ncbi:DUF4381 domain-containing protein [Marinobacter fonticola]|uniref:DUF4381 domain-containing protein n=1 Tax=Marinobacter fonticola TaxID=2603215 RepID=UPI0011E6B773|nr:DUF4381 domain-containing protein [Marinobacter fonticola]
MSAPEPAVATPDLIDLMGRLAEPAEPPAVSMLPQTQGWLWLALIVLLVLACLGSRAARRWRANAYRREALAALARSEGDPVIVAQVPRRTALAAWPRREVVSLTGNDWLQFLDQTGGGGRFAQGGGDLIRAPYVANKGRASNSPLRALAADWIRHHRAPQPEKAG